MEESLLAAQKLADWSRLSATVSHEIRNPLEAIQNLQYLIRTSEGVPAEIAEFARLAAEEANRVLVISGATLSFIRQSAKPEEVDLCEAMESVELLLAPLIREKKIAFAMQASGPCSVEALAGEPRQVLLNLVRNACEATTNAGAQVTVTLTGQESGVAIEIADQGTGIAPEVLPTLFEFGSSTKGDRGNGMGLWSAQHIVRKHRGEIQVESRPGVGTRFMLWWPRGDGFGMGSFA
jgi:signal transduction histidine kinase